MSQRIGVGLIGVGNIGRVHLSGLVALRDAGLLDIEIAAICDTNPDALQSALELFKPTVTYDSYDELVNDEGVDVVYICTPTNQHSDMVKAAASVQKPVLCEKPLTHSCPQARELVAVTQSREVPSAVGLVLRYDQFLLHAKHLIETKDFGHPMLAHIRDDQHFPVDYVYQSTWRGEKAIAGGGTLIEHSIHDIDILQWFLGDIENVYAKISHFSKHDVEDQASLIMTHKNGAVSTLDSVWHWVERPSERHIEFFFEKGFINIILESGNRYLVYHLKGDGPVRINGEIADDALIETLGLNSKNISPDAVHALTKQGSERYAALSYSFLTSIQSGDSPSPNFIDAIAAHKIIDAAYESASKGTEISPL